MKIDFTTPLLSIDGEIVTLEKNKVTLWTLTKMALTPHTEAMIKDLSFEQKLDIYALALKIKENLKAVDLKSEEITLIKNRLDQAGIAPFFLGRAVDVLEGRNVEREAQV